MITLCIDTAYKYLTCALIDDDKIIASFSEECFKHQSEELMNALEKVFSESNIKKDDIDAICITKGPGSYTGVRIAMSLAKTICILKKIKLYTISTLALYASGKEKQLVLMDARSNRAYVGVYDENKVVIKDCIKELDKIDYEGLNLCGDAHLLGFEDKVIDIPSAFLMTRSVWEEVININYLVPEYLKESDSYYR